MGGTPCACGLSSKKHKFMFIKNILRLQLAVQEQTKSDEKDKDRASPKTVRDCPPNQKSPI